MACMHMDLCIKVQAQQRWFPQMGFVLGSGNLYNFSHATWIKVEDDANKVGKSIRFLFLDLMLFCVLWDTPIWTLGKGMVQIQKETKIHKTKVVCKSCRYQVSIETPKWLEQKSINQKLFIRKTS